MGDFPSGNISVSYVHIVVNLFRDYLLGSCVQIKENILTAIISSFSHTVDHNNTGSSKPHSVITLNVGIAFNCSLFVDSWNSIDSIRNTPSDDGTVGGFTDGNKFFSPMIIFMVHVEVDEARL